ncbi:hypothetical protein ACFP2T_46920 [Plantactinospora solaniradicis]|uniref:Uncharacterized protein n=1 Tax=Plantactinospora solaniradicis TaxID=1723736 RepID=A0ABW1KQJ3_9ACTN
MRRHAVGYQWSTWYWLIGSPVLGPVLGFSGALIRRRGPVGTLSRLLVPAGAALHMVLLPPPPDSSLSDELALTASRACVVQ